MFFSRVSIAAVFLGVITSLGLSSAPAQAASPAPTGLAAIGSNPRAISVRWDAVAGAFGYRIDYATKPDYTNRVGETTTGTTRVLSNGATGLLPATTYYIRVMVIDRAGRVVSPVSKTISYATKRAMRLAVGSYNIKNPNSSSLAPWSSRCPLIGKDIVKLSLRVVGLQELYRDENRAEMLDCINSAAGGRYYAMTLEPDAREGMDNRIVYDTRVFRLIRSGAYAYPTQLAGETSRQLVWATLQDIASGRVVLLTTTHLEPTSDSVLTRQWDQLIAYVNRLKTAQQASYVVLTGDFNTTKFETPAGTQLAKMRSNGYEDVLGQQYRSYSTYRNPVNRFESWIGSSNRGNRDIRSYSVSPGKNSNSIDYVFVTKSLRALYYRVWAQPRHGYLMDYLLSDHFLVSAIISE